MRRLSRSKIATEKANRARGGTTRRKRRAPSAKMQKAARDSRPAPSGTGMVVALSDTSWAKSLNALVSIRKAVNDPENLELFAGALDYGHTVDGIRAVLSAAFSVQVADGAK